MIDNMNPMESAIWAAAYGATFVKTVFRDYKENQKLSEYSRSSFEYSADHADDYNAIVVADAAVVNYRKSQGE